ncbi:MAG: glycosyltransferase WbuB [Gammaproteobacteria bacterium]|nr:glycosyltransferase WbuB [Gammaproteobacteria bacterium]
MKILLYGLNYSPELTGVGKYTGELGSWLASQGHEVHAVVAPPYYPEWKVDKSYRAWWYQKEDIDGVAVHRCPIYVPGKPHTLTRLLHLISFALSSFFVLLRKWFWKPDVIIVMEPTSFCKPGALMLGKLTGAKTVLHIQDFEVDAMLGLCMMNLGRVEGLVRGIDNWLIRKFDVVSSISLSMLENARQKGAAEDALYLLPNWSDTDFVNATTSGDAMRAEWGFAANDQVVLYSGNLGQKQGLEIVLEAADALRNRPEIKFVLVGAGGNLERLQAQAQSLNLDNVFFEPLQPWSRVPQLLAMADIHLVVQRKGAADVVLPSKLTNILAAGGHALVTAEAETELGRLAKLHPRIYTLVEPENPPVFIAALSDMIDASIARRQSSGTGARAVNSVARRYAEEYLNQDNILAAFEQELLRLVSAEADVAEANI